METNSTKERFQNNFVNSTFWMTDSYSWTSWVGSAVGSAVGFALVGGVGGVGSVGGVAARGRDRAKRDLDFE